MASHSDRLVKAGSVALDSASAARELERCGQEYGMNHWETHARCSELRYGRGCRECDRLLTCRDKSRCRFCRRTTERRADEEILYNGRRACMGMAA